MSNDQDYCGGCGKRIVACGCFLVSPVQGAASMAGLVQSKQGEPARRMVELTQGGASAPVCPACKGERGEEVAYSSTNYGWRECLTCKGTGTGTGTGTAVSAISRSTAAEGQWRGDTAASASTIPTLTPEIITQIREAARASHDDPDSAISRMVGATEGISTHLIAQAWIAASASDQGAAVKPCPDEYAGLKGEIETLQWRLGNAMRELEARRLHDKGDVWHWQGDGTDSLDSMSMGMVVVIRADQFRAALAERAQAQPTAGLSAERVRKVLIKHLGWLGAVSWADDIAKICADLATPAPEQEAAPEPIGFISEGVIEHALAQGMGASAYIQAVKTAEFPVAIYTAPVEQEAAQVGAKLAQFDGITVCPFCAYLAELHSDTDSAIPGHSVMCRSCGAEGPVESTAEVAISRWNERAGPLAAPVAQEASQPEPTATLLELIHHIIPGAAVETELQVLLAVESCMIVLDGGAMPGDVKAEAFKRWYETKWRARRDGAECDGFEGCATATNTNQPEGEKGGAA